MEMGCCGYFGFSRRSRRSTRSRRLPGSVTQSSQESLLDSEADDENDSYDGEAEDGDTGEISSRSKSCEEILVYRIQNGLICRPVPVKAVRSEVETPEDILKANRLIFPGVGAFAPAMDVLNDKGRLKSDSDIGAKEHRDRG